MFPAAVAAVLASACGDDDGPASRLPYDPDETVIIGADGTEFHNSPSGTGCIELASGGCVRPQEPCGEGTYADVLLDSGGDVNEIVCLPVESDTLIIDVEDGVATVPGNGAVVILDDRDLLSDVRVDGNRATIYGDSPAEAVIEGELTLRGNESTVRGVTVTGDVTFDGNAAELYYCVVYGDIILRGNENFISNCTIFGSIVGSGNQDRVISNFVQGSIRFDGPVDECRDNQRFTDNDGDLFLDEAEAVAAEPADCED
jgi:hypothetical protein